MQNSLSVPPKDHGSVSTPTSPGEKQRPQQALDSPGKTVCTGKRHWFKDLKLFPYDEHANSLPFIPAKMSEISCLRENGKLMSTEHLTWWELLCRLCDINISSGTGQSGKSLQSKSQFRTIAPKLAPKVLTSRVLPCHSPSLSEQGTLGPSMSPKPVGVPTQNYALMQVAGQEGTFSLVALPPVASAQPVQKPRMPENLKLPIPRYQPLRSTKGPGKKPGLSSPESGCSKSLAHTQTCREMSPSLPAHPELPQKPSPCRQMPAPDQAPVRASAAPLAEDGGCGSMTPPATNSCRDLNPLAAAAPSTPAQPSAKRSRSDSSGRANHTSKKEHREPSAVAGGKLKEQADQGKAMSSSSPAVLGSVVQLIPSVLKGRVPILPYTRVQAADVCKPGSDTNTADVSSPEHRTGCDRRASVIEGFSAAPKMASKAPVPPVPKQILCGSAFCPVTKTELTHKTKLNVGAAKRRGRKRKVPDDILAFQGKRKKSISNKCRDAKEKAKNSLQESKDQKPGALKKYRSIMPKPIIVLSALPSLASPAATLPSQTTSSLAQDVLLSKSITSKCLSCKQSDSPSPKPNSVFRNGFSGVKKPWHRCQVCNHHFQFKQHLRDHMNTHTDRRPYSCRLCRKAYVRSGSLSTHMRLHHGENRLKKRVCCEFCAKVFGHVRVYFGHLKEVHRVVISTEPTPSEPQPEDMLKSRDRGTGDPGREAALQQESKSTFEEDFLLNQADEVKLQIKCGRCQITAQSFAEIKFHLLYVHGEEIQGRLQEGISPSHRGAQEALAKHTIPDWKQHPERRKQVKLCASKEDSLVLPKMKRQLSFHREEDVEILKENEGGQLETKELREDRQGPECGSPHSVFLWSHSGFSCLLCAQTLGRKEELFLHWESHHNCEDPSRLWDILSTFSNQGVIDISRETGK
ncbi:PREDICTED: zinc finger protein 438 isoform X3 [Chinchilla lanigera]|nr:PREDICTED: zinc finger protein 438 isoform X3 [Chinchilla lanigera]XP_005387260.1 PREDICTED: zinc finger protein 438 isoform X3 [Chinchilla lanigera]XP_005387261.1 PREDICTED: zinc finger protein 438 isoform X3 [Chinchilla lanigera]XP_005387262.1 PREDICTED: zinc finger protein 438 isoform X3 [Chinchilla lanigera]XP_005387263.1 PREDICTED: zinc finger protein 438 isoform X3 [Chinchilla lanigera]XP_013370922.1 PREDICTED: zinc finger protein 438 isoform X3 [Chinchilla lanigera]